MPAPVIRAGRLLPGPGPEPAPTDARILVSGAEIAEVGGAGAAGDEPGALGGPGTLAMPALVDAHDHGRGLKTVSYGAGDDALELWLPFLAAEPRVDPYLVALAAFARLARSGVGTVNHAHGALDPDAMVAEAQAVARAAREVGIRVAFIVPIMDRNPVAYGGVEAIRGAHAPADWDAIAQATRLPPARVQLEAVDAVAAACESEDFRVQFGPIGPQWCADATLETIAAASQRSGRRVHMHLLETRAQREWSDARYRTGLVRHLDSLGLLSPRLTVAHGVWLKPDECELLAGRGAVVAVNTSSNLRLRSGVAPVAAFLAAGLKFALGLDGLALDDDDDMLRELRLTYRMHRGIGLAPGLTPAGLLEAALGTGFRTFSGADGATAVTPGAAADILVLDHGRMAGDVLEGATDDLELLLTRATADHVKDLVVAGRVVVRDGRLTGVDLGAVERELHAQARAAAPASRARRELFERHKGVLGEYYGSGGHIEG